MLSTGNSITQLPQFVLIKRFASCFAVCCNIQVIQSSCVQHMSQLCGLMVITSRHQNSLKMLKMDQRVVKTVVDRGHMYRKSR